MFCSYGSAPCLLRITSAMTLTAMHDQNADQIAYWNGPGGTHWTDRQLMQDVVLAPVSEILMREAKAAAGERVIDIGCGCGATTIDLARHVGPTGHVLGIDVSAPMLTRARELAPPLAPVKFVHGDATVYSFKSAQTDLLFSRFGVMFFAKPASSFANMRQALHSGGRLVFACWREPRDNGWLIVPLQAAYNHVPKLPPLGPEDPGPFSFASEQRVHRILIEAGFSSVTVKRFDLFLDLAVGRGLDVAVNMALEIGPASRALEGHSDNTRAAAAKSIRAALAKFQKGESVPLPGSIWMVTAANS